MFCILFLTRDLYCVYYEKILYYKQYAIIKRKISLSEYVPIVLLVILLLFALRCEHFSSPRHVRVFLRHCDFIDRRIGALCNFDDLQTDLITAQECTYASLCDRSSIKLSGYGKLLINIHAERFNYYSLLRACQYSESVVDTSSIEVDVVDRIPPVLGDTPLSLSAVK